MTNSEFKGGLRRGDVVEVKSVDEIMATLDAEGKLDHLVFMPEMIEHCGKTFKVAFVADHVVTDGVPTIPKGESRVRRFVNDDVVLLEGMRCPGSFHNGCKKDCTIFWKLAWLKKPGSPPKKSDPEKVDRIQASLKTMSEPDVYYCQSSEIIKATRTLTSRQRLLNPIQSMLIGNYGLLQMTRMVLVWLYCRIRTRLFGIWPVGSLTSTPQDSLDLQPGDWVDVKTLEEIRETLDAHGKNRGLHFSSDMIPYCGRRLQVRARFDNFIIEGVGKMRSIRNTVTLEGSVCDSAIYSLAGCPRAHILYWRDIWVRKVPAEKTRVPARSERVTEAV